MPRRRQGNQGYVRQSSLLEIKRRLVRLLAKRFDSGVLLRRILTTQIVAIDR